MADDRPGSLFEYFERRRRRPPNPLGLWIAGGLVVGTVVAAATGEVATWVVLGALAGAGAGLWRRSSQPPADPGNH